MMNITLHQVINDPQYFCAKEGTNMRRTVPENIFIRDLIRTNAKYSGDGCSLFVCDLDKQDKKLLLSYMVSAEDYEYALSSPSRLDAMLVEYAKDMQSAINALLDDVYHEDMEEMGLVLCHHHDNNEPYWVKS